MGLFKCRFRILVALFLLFVAVVLQLLLYGLWWKSSPLLSELNYNEFWGPTKLKDKEQNQIVREFKVKFEKSIIEDLKRRLNNRKWKPPLEGIGFEYGFNTDQLNGWLEYWQNEYPFEKQEEFLNQVPHYKTNIQGLDIHFIRVKDQNIPENKEVVPLLILHGWPGSVREFYETIPSLISFEKDRDFAVEVIAPSLPGFGFSDAAARPGMGTVEMAIIMRNLMHRLGYKRFYVQGGDWGSIIGSAIATVFPEEVLGYHTNLALNFGLVPSILVFIGSIYPPLLVREDLSERMYPLNTIYSVLLEESGYFHVQATKPDTIGVALTDSPAGLLAYILEKFSVATNVESKTFKDGGLGRTFSKDQLIDNLMIYWSTRSITSSMRIYAEALSKKSLGKRMDNIPTSVPTWALQAKHEISYLPPYLLKFKYTNLINATVLHEGGHFLALEMPQVFAKDVLTAIGKFRKWHKNNRVELKYN